MVHACLAAAVITECHQLTDPILQSKELWAEHGHRTKPHSLHQHLHQSEARVRQHSTHPPPSSLRHLPRRAHLPWPLEPIAPSCSGCIRGPQSRPYLATNACTPRSRKWG
ncbi:hypothetical protein I7I50_12684 [Histoplasma capsulatum G186AR]|uniref:Uncharacterized protein n=1 Tax=Ajellomyces capsulatus TaxID=5037 RepID=A0A8H7Y9P3_AJECA|nr:hypothetical protein I7I52_11011 [Histoplasma capsulatum]QSS70903.1 hypothetical protein I7I50_12684 [Histoplasma capsulatum G186AR]